MSFCDDLIFVTGGMDNGQNLINDFKFMTLSNGDWIDLRVARKNKDEKKKAAQQQQ